MSTQRTSATLLIIGFDAEWFEDPTWVKPAEKDFDPKNPAHYPRNIILSYQYACRLGREQVGQGIIWTRAGAERRFPGLSPAQLAKYPERVKFSDIIGQALETYPRSITGRRKWPGNVLATAHWTRADFSAMGDFDKIKGHFDGVQKSYVEQSLRLEPEGGPPPPGTADPIVDPNSDPWVITAGYRMDGRP